MTKNRTCFLFIMSFLFLETGDGTVLANQQYTVPYFEDHSRRVGYKTVNEAVKEFENICNCKVTLPTLMPRIPFTHEFGSLYEDKKNSANKNLQILFVNRKLKSNNFKIEIRMDKMHFEGKDYTLQEGIKGIFFEDHLFSYLVFEKDKLQYRIGLDKNIDNSDALEVLTEVANSIN